MKKLAILGGKPEFSEWVPIVKPHLPVHSEFEGQIADIITSGILTKGKHLTKLETAIASKLQVEYAIGVSSCTMGLFLTFLALGLKGEVIVPSFTFLATVSSLVVSGLVPVFVDVDHETCTMDSSAIEQAITDKTSAIVAVHTFGNPARISELETFAKHHDMVLIFDAAHALGSSYKNRPVGRQGKAQIFSLSPTKLVTAGEGGIVATNDSELAGKLKIAREYGMVNGYDSQFASLNARLPEINALIGIKSLDLLEPAVAHRNSIALRYKQNLSSIPGIGFQHIDEEDVSSYKDFTIMIHEERFGLNRDTLIEILKNENIDTRAYYNPPVHLQTAYRQFYRGESLVHTETLVRECLSLPLWSNIDNDIVDRICYCIQAAHEHYGKIHQFRI